MAIISRELISKHSKVLEFTSIWHDTFRNGTFSLDNTNKLIRYYEGADGLKTGFTTKAGYCLSATAIRKNLRLISVVLGEADTNIRFAETKKLLDYGFLNYEVFQISNKGEQVKTLEVKKGIDQNIKTVLENDVNLSIIKFDKSKIKKEEKLEEYLTAPIKKGQKVGEILYKIGDNIIGKVNVVAESDVEKASFIRLFMRMILKWLGFNK